jgi:EF hand/EF-hand domain pair
MGALDADGDGVVNYKEFIAATVSLYQVSRGVLPTQRAVWQNRLRVLFNELDSDHDGRISEAELLELMPDKKEVRKIMQARALFLAVSAQRSHACCRGTEGHGGCCASGRAAAGGQCNLAHEKVACLHPVVVCHADDRQEQRWSDRL